MVVNSRAFADLKAAVAEAEKAGAILIVDSVTHCWEELRESFLAAKRLRLRNQYARLELPDWNQIKPQWGTFTTAFLNSKAHIILCGRGASVYETQEDDETGKKSMIAAGTRMAAEKGLGYEPSLLVEMTARQVTGPGKRKTIVRTATVLKDRADVLDGLQFEDPKFESFLPHIEHLNIGGTPVVVDTTRTSEGLFPTEGGGRDTSAVRREIVLDDTKDLLLKHIPGQSAADKQRKTDLVRRHFGCGWVEAEQLLSLDKLKAGFAGIKAELEPEKPIDEIPHAEPAAVPAGGEPDDGEIVLRDLIAEVTKEPDAKKRKAIWDDSAKARESLTDDQVGRLRAVLDQMDQQAGKPRGKQQAAA
jgi:hypothetical protein